jgi:predicted nuclease with TOPRIM domain
MDGTVLMGHRFTPDQANFIKSQANQNEFMRSLVDKAMMGTSINAEKRLKLESKKAERDRIRHTELVLDREIEVIEDELKAIETERTVLHEQATDMLAGLFKRMDSLDKATDPALVNWCGGWMEEIAKAGVKSAPEMVVKYRDWKKANR